MVRFTPGRHITAFPVPNAGAGLSGITAGLDGNRWFVIHEAVSQDGGQIGCITPTGQNTEVPLLVIEGGGPVGITTGPDGNLWMTEDDAIARLTP
jgi:virginiamycin B lyase